MSDIRTRCDCAIGVVSAINANGGVNPDVFEVSSTEFEAVMDDFAKSNLRILSKPIDRPNFIIMGIPVVVKDQSVA